uniref:Uncharacterized protein n=1 Tax=Plectus sambesii TaxID=2011161 RepID=A0A914WEC9_9BILA
MVGQSAAAAVIRPIVSRSGRRTVRASGRAGAGCALEARKAAACPVVAAGKPVQATLFAACATGCETSGACRRRPVVEVGHVRSAVRPSPADSTRPATTGRRRRRQRRRRSSKQAQRKGQPSDALCANGRLDWVCGEADAARRGVGAGRAYQSLFIYKYTASFACKSSLRWRGDWQVR